MSRYRYHHHSLALAATAGFFQLIVMMFRLAWYVGVLILKTSLDIAQALGRLIMHVAGRIDARRELHERELRAAAHEDPRAFTAELPVPEPEPVERQHTVARPRTADAYRPVSTAPGARRVAGSRR